MHNSYFELCPIGRTYQLLLQMEDYPIVLHWHLPMSEQFSNPSCTVLFGMVPHRVRLYISFSDWGSLTLTEKWPIKFTAQRMWPGGKWPQEATDIKRRRNKYLKPQKNQKFWYILLLEGSWILEVQNRNILLSYQNQLMIVSWFSISNRECGQGWNDHKKLCI